MKTTFEKLYFKNLLTIFQTENFTYNFQDSNPIHPNFSTGTCILTKIELLVMYPLFLDDIRTPEMAYEPKQAQEFVVVRSYTAFVNYIKKKRSP